MDREISAALSGAARSVSKATSVEETLETIVQVAQKSLPGFDHVGISSIDKRGRIETRAQTGDLVRQLDDLQYELGEGPCVDTLRTADFVAAPHIRHDQRWPRYVPAAVQLGLKSQFAVKLYLDDEGTLGGLNIYSSSNEGIDDEVPVLAELFATQAALALGKVRELNNLTAALQSREVIGKALGLIMATHQVDEKGAFAYLARLSSTSNIKMRDLAAGMLEQHQNDLHR
jgi:GAF domain-containing protein